MHSASFTQNMLILFISLSVCKITQVFIHNCGQKKQTVHRSEITRETLPEL